MRTIAHIGKESNRLEDVQVGLVEDLAEVLGEYNDFYTGVFVPLVLPVPRQLGVRETARRTRHSVVAVSAALSGRSRPRQPQLAGYLTTASDHARAWLTERSIPMPADQTRFLP